MKPLLVHKPLLALLIIGLLQGCANIVPPSGGKKDETPPQLLSATPRDSQLHTKLQRLDLRFDEYVILSDASKEIQVSPILPIPPTVVVANKRVTLTFADSLLMDSTTYRISFGKAIQDLHENNPFTGYQYTFSTGGYFDSLRLEGTVLQALTGMPDTGAFVLLYAASVSDSTVIREKPLYAVRTEASGKFVFQGLPPRRFRLYALLDKNDNMRYDGDEERIAFTTTIIHPAEDTIVAEPLRTFRELTPTDSVDRDEQAGGTGKRVAAISKKEQDDGKEELTYRVAVDTSNRERRTLDVTKPLLVTCSREVAVDTSRISLTYEKDGNEVLVPIEIDRDTTSRNVFQIKTDWEEDAVYTLRLLKGFVRDSAGIEAMPSRHIFRTKHEDDYARLRINIPSAYYGSKHLLLVMNATDTIHHKPVTDTVVRLPYLPEGSFTLRIIVDENENGQWDTGDLLEGRQPEWVYPHKEAVRARGGWEHVVDFRAFGE